MNVGDLYRELAEDYRYHLAWRERLLAGFVIASGSLAVGYTHAGAFKWAVALSGFEFSLAILFFEERCHEILLSRREAGVALEKSVLDGSRGFLYIGPDFLGQPRE